MRKTTTLLTVLLIIALICGCANTVSKPGDDNNHAENQSGNEEAKESGNSTGENGDTGKTVEDQVSQVKNRSKAAAINSNSGMASEYSVTQVYKFSEGLAWIVFEDQYGSNYTGCIDKKGNLVFYFQGNYYTDAFEDGYGYLSNYTNVFMIDSTGKILASYSKPYVYGDNANGIVYWGGGYIIEQEEHSGFDEAEYAYSIKDAEGNVLHSFTYESTSPLASFWYLGHGIFAYQFNTGTVNLYFAKSDKLIENYKSYNRMNGYIVSDKYLIFNEGLYSSDYNEDEYEEYFYFSLSDFEGNVRDIKIPEEFCGYYDAPSVVSLDSNYVLLMHKNENYILYDIDKGTFREYDGEYADRLGWNTSIGFKQCCGLYNGIMALQLKGKDEEKYVVLVDPDMQSRCKPIKAETFYFMDGSLVTKPSEFVKHVDLYDMDGNLESAFDGDVSVTGANEGVMVVNNEYYYHDGTRLFENVDFSKGKLVGDVE